MDTDDPGCMASSTSRSFSAADHRRRRCTDVITSTRGPGVSEFVVIVVFIGVRLCLIELCQTVRSKQGAVRCPSNFSRGVPFGVPLSQGEQGHSHVASFAGFDFVVDALPFRQSASTVPTLNRDTAPGYPAKRGDRVVVCLEKAKSVA